MRAIGLRALLLYQGLLDGGVEGGDTEKVCSVTNRSETAFMKNPLVFSCRIESGNGMGQVSVAGAGSGKKASDRYDGPFDIEVKKISYQGIRRLAGLEIDESSSRFENSVELFEVLDENLSPNIQVSCRKRYHDRIEHPVGEGKG
jgi:hypothetical protein